MHGPVPQASPPQPQVSHSITAAGTPSVARSAAYFLQLHLEYGVEPTHSCWICALPGTQGVHRSSKRCVPAARAGCGAATNSRHAFWDIFDAFVPYTRTTTPETLGEDALRCPLTLEQLVAGSLLVRSCRPLIQVQLNPRLVIATRIYEHDIFWLTKRGPQSSSCS